MSRIKTGVEIQMSRRIFATCDSSSKQKRNYFLRASLKIEFTKVRDTNTDLNPF